MSLYSITLFHWGKIEFKGHAFEGQHTPIVDASVFEQAQAIRKENSVDPKTYTKGSTPALLNGRTECGFCSSSLTTTSTQKPSGKKYYYYKCVQKNKKGQTAGHAPKDLSVPALDNFVFKTFQLLLREPELLKAMKKRATYEGKSNLEQVQKKIQRFHQRIKSSAKDISNTMRLLTKNPDGLSSSLYQQ